MYNFDLNHAPILVLMACPVCKHQQTEHTGVSIVASQFVLCGAHRAHFERLLRDPKVPRIAITCWLNLLRK